MVIVTHGGFFNTRPILIPVYLCHSIVLSTSSEVDNKETFTKEHMWEIFKSFMNDMASVRQSNQPARSACVYWHVNLSHLYDFTRNDEREQDSLLCQDSSSTAPVCVRAWYFPARPLLEQVCNCGPYTDKYVAALG